ncbi:MAG: ion transporter [Rhizobiales bacterium]|nr:ion transporter [Hyphomicrobiales bacterium]MBI3672082.1 ion transporter [Hyphomicrobiales bacterium]
MLPSLRRIFTDPHYSGYRIWHNIVMVFIFASCASLALESVQSLSDNYGSYFNWSEWITVAFFTADAVANIAFAPRPLRYVFSFWGLIDIISVAPSYLMLLNLTAVRGTKTIRLLRVARVLRVLKLARAAADQAKGAEHHETNPILANLKIYFIIFFAVLMISSTAMYFVEGYLYAPDVLQAGQDAIDMATPAGQRPATYMPVDPLSGATIAEDKRFFTSIPAAMWWSMTTMTTTGYGDMYPVTVGGRLVASFTMLFGLVLFGILLNIISKTMMILFFGEKLPDD